MQRSSLELLLVAKLASNGNSIRDIQPNGGNGCDGWESCGVSKRWKTQKTSNQHRQPNSIDWGLQKKHHIHHVNTFFDHVSSPPPLPTPYLALFVNEMPPLTSRHSTVTRKGVDHTRIGSNGSKSAEPAGKNQHHHENNTTSITHTVYNDLHDWESWSGGNGGIEILYTKKETNDKEPSHDTTDYNIPHAMVSNCTPIFQSPKQYIPMIAMVIPTGPLISALWVSSDICALESYPVKVNCACKSPTKTT